VIMQWCWLTQNSDNNPDIWTDARPEEVAQALKVQEAEPDDFAYHFNETPPFRTPKIPEPVSEAIEYAPSTKRLIEKFRETGLQVIVKMASIELTPDKHEYFGGGWHVSSSSPPFRIVFYTHTCSHRWKVK
jgi:hypothetical protein